MKIKIFDDYESLSFAVAEVVRKALEKKKKTTFALPSGSTPLGLYRELIKLYNRKKIDFSEAAIFALDEYLGFSETDRDSFSCFLKTNFLNHVNVLPQNSFFPIANENNVEEVCKWYEKEIDRHGGLDLAIVGIGVNGHIAFNEPGSGLKSITRLIKLTPETISYNEKNFQDTKKIPTFGVTMGISTIMKAQEILLIANGKNKSKILEKCFKGPISKEKPASFLQNHKALSIFIDKEASF